MATTFEYSPGVQLHYEICGSGSKPIVLMHGFAASLETWRDIQPYLEPRFLLYLVDLKGFGLSSKPDDGRYSIADQASIMASFVRTLKLRGVSLVGNSYGGAVALATCLQLAETDAAAVQSLVLIDAPATTQKLPFFVWPLRNAVLSRVVALAPARLRAKRVLRRVVADPACLTGERVERWARFHDLPGSHRALRAVARQILPDAPGADLARLARIRCPVLILWGDRDPVIFRWQADLLAKHIPHARLVVIPRCGHLPQEERPEETARELVRFLET